MPDWLAHRVESAFMRRILITGMSGTGKSTVVLELQRLGFHAVDADTSEYSEFVQAAPGDVTGVGNGLDWAWKPDEIERLLDSGNDDILLISGCSPNQGRFSSRFDRIVLLTADKATIAKRLSERTSNSFGKSADELARTLQLVDEIEPLLRERADVIIDTGKPLEQVVARIVKVIEDHA